jgi:chromosomal replication initiation ATPase DnaA
MKDNLEAKFYETLLTSTQKELSSIESISFQIDTNIDNPSNADVVDCTAFYKEDSRNKKMKTASSSKNIVSSQTSSNAVKDRYSLGNFVVG